MIPATLSSKETHFNWARTCWLRKFQVFSHWQWELLRILCQINTAPDSPWSMFWGVLNRCNEPTQWYWQVPCLYYKTMWNSSFKTCSHKKCECIFWGITLTFFCLSFSQLYRMETKNLIFIIHKEEITNLPSFSTVLVQCVL